MNDDQTMFAEMLGIKRQAPEAVAHVARSVDRPSGEAEDFVDELDVQKEVVEEMAREKALLEECRDRLEADKEQLEAEKRTLQSESQLLASEKQALEAENQRLQSEMRTLESAKGALEQERQALTEKVASLEEALSRARAELDAKDADNPMLAAVRAENAALEVKLARMGRALMAARRAAAEATKVEIGGRRW